MSDEELCPVCGQPFEYRREEASTSEYELRSDATECRVECDLTTVQTITTAYVHLRPGAKQAIADELSGQVGVDIDPENVDVGQLCDAVYGDEE